ncbi:MAG: SGNH/GDSL hydrolase family protein [Actinomycetes bacterium]
MTGAGEAARKVVSPVLRVAPFVLLPVVALLIALAVTPPVTVSAFGQTVQVGAVTPNLHLGLSGPGEADLFGEGTLETVQHFDGPIRPRLVWQRFNRNDEASQFIQSTSANGRRVVRTGSREVGQALAAGWADYFKRLLLMAALIGAALYLLGVGAVALLSGHEHRHRSRRHHLALLAVAAGSSVLVTGGFTALTVVSASRQLDQVRSLSDLVGTAKLAPVPITVGPTRTDVDAVVIGDSTAAGIGNTPLAKPTRADRFCRRSADAYAVALQSASGLTVVNLACSSATIADGLLGPQTLGPVTLSPQVGVLESITSARLVVVSIGANDVGWSDFMRYCYGLKRCDDQASDSLFQSRLDSFKVQYSQLLQQLGDLPGHPAVIVNEYYDPFGASFDCPQLQDAAARAGAPAGYGFAADPGQDNQDEKVKQKIEPLESELSRMNAVIEQGAQAFGFTPVKPSFAGHELCSDQSWVQGMNDKAPFHPNSAGELAIAAADLRYVAAVAAPPA